MRSHGLLLTLAALALPALVGPSRLTAWETTKLPVTREESITWHDDYQAALKHAQEHEQLLFLWFADPAQADDNDKFFATVLNSSEVQRLLTGMTLARISTSATSEVKDQQVPVLKQSSYAELQGGPGLAIVDLRDKRQKFYGHVVSVYPFRRGVISTAKVKALCELPAGTLTQRTLIFAVRTHRAAPQSAWSPHSSFLAAEAEKHSLLQARIHLQGHHQWESRFHQINAGLGVGGAREVCAESWGGQSLLEAAEECVHSWSQSSGHWASVSARHAFFGYDMKRGTNGVWYATGIFGGR